MCIIYIITTNDFESDKKYVPYKEIVKKRALDYYYANKKVISEKNKSRYQSMTPEQIKKSQENTKRWLNNLSPERQAELKQKAREYHRNRYHDLIVEVK